MVEVRGIEPLAPCLQSRCSPAELHPHGEFQCRFSPSWLSTNFGAARITRRMAAYRTVATSDGPRLRQFSRRHRVKELPGLTAALCQPGKSHFGFCDVANLFDTLGRAGYDVGQLDLSFDMVTTRPISEEAP